MWILPESIVLQTHWYILGWTCNNHAVEKLFWLKSDQESQTLQMSLLSEHHVHWTCIQALIVATEYNFAHFYEVRPWMSFINMTVKMLWTETDRRLYLDMELQDNFSWWCPERNREAELVCRGTPPPPPLWNQRRCRDHQPLRMDPNFPEDRRTCRAVLSEIMICCSWSLLLWLDI